jgi:hypothetical protein
MSILNDAANDKNSYIHSMEVYLDHDGVGEEKEFYFKATY